MEVEHGGLENDWLVSFWGVWFLTDSGFYLFGFAMAHLRLALFPGILHVTY